MIANVVNLMEHAALRMGPERALRWLGHLPATGLDALRRRRLRHTLATAARKSPFYRHAFASRGIDLRDVGHPGHLGDFFTTGEDLRKSDSDAFLTGRPDTAFETTGTTSPVPKRVFFSRREIADMGRLTALWLHVLGLRREDRVVSAFDCSFWVSPVVLRAGLDLLGTFHVEAGKIEPREFYVRASAYRPTAIFGEPSWMVRFSEIAADRGAWPVKLLFAGGEGITDQARTLVEQVWQAPLYLNYGQTESFGALGAECRLKRGYHRNDFYFWFEIDRPDASGFGEIVYTTLARDTMPLIRYRSSDVAQLIDEPCACGISMGRISRIRGRCDEMVVCGMGNVGPWVFEDILRGVAGVGDEWQVVVSTEGAADVVELRVESAGGPADELAGAIRANMRERFPDFWKNLEMRLYHFRIVHVQPGSLRGDGRKLRRIVDARGISQGRPVGAIAQSARGSEA